MAYGLKACSCHPLKEVHVDRTGLGQVSRGVLHDSLL